MVRIPLQTRKGFTSSLAMAVALATGTMVLAAGLTTPAYAAKKKDKDKKAEGPDYSDAFIEAYVEANDLFKAAADAPAAEPIREKIPGVIAAVATDDDRLAAGQLVLNLGIKLNDKALQRQGVDTQLASGKLPAENLGMFEFYSGRFAYEAKEYGKARASLQSAVAHGYDAEPLQGLIAETYFNAGEIPQGLAYLKGEIDKIKAAGGAVDESWVRRGLAFALESRQAAATNEWSALLVENAPSQENWHLTSQLVREMNELGAHEMLDVGRLMDATNSYVGATDYFDYVDAAASRGLPNEVVRIIDKGVAAGALSMTDVAVKDAYNAAKSNAAADRKETPGLMAEARSAANGVTALGVADAFLSFEDYANAEDMYKLALAKGDIDADRVQTRLGIAQALQGKLAEARASFSAVSGARKPLAALWLAFVKQKEAGAAL